MGKELPNALYIVGAYYYVRQITWAIIDRKISLFNKGDVIYKSLKV